MFLKNKIVVYLITRYLTYGLQFFISMVVAVRLGTYYLGLYGIIQLILNYANLRKLVILLKYSYYLK